MPDGGEWEAFLTTDHNAEMIEHIARYPRVRDRAIFVGDPDDIVSLRHHFEQNLHVREVAYRPVATDGAARAASLLAALL